MEEEKKKRKNKKKKNKQSKGIENSAEESASSNQNHAADIPAAEAHTDDTSGVDDDPSRHVTDGAKVATLEEKVKQLQKDKETHKQREVILEEKLKQLAKEKDANLLKEASQEEKIRLMQMEKDVYLLKEVGFEERISELVHGVEKLNLKRVSLEEKVKETEKETENRVQKKVVLEERISQLVDEVENLNSMRVSLEEKVKEMEKERDIWVQKEKSFREIISSLSGDNALLEMQVKELEELRTTLVQQNQLLQENTESLQTQVHNREKSAALPYSPTGSKMIPLENGDLNSELVATRALVDKLVNENTELVEKVNKLYVELERRGSVMEVSSSLGSADIFTRSSEVACVVNESALGSDMRFGAVHGEPNSKSNDRVPQSAQKLVSLADAIDKAGTRVHEQVAKTDGSIVNSSEIESDEIVQIPLDENEVEAANVDDEEVPLTNAPLIGAPFRLISFFAGYVSGADLINKNSATSNC